MRTLWTLLVAAGWLAAPAQIRVISGDSLPATGKEGDWFCHPWQAGQVHVYHGGGWQHLPIQDGRHVRERGGLVWIRNSDMDALATLDGRLLMDYCMHVREVGSVVVGNSFSNGFALHKGGDTLALFSNGWGHPCLQPQSLGGRAVFCLPVYCAGTERYTAHERCGWGMVDSTGTWVIAPLYDHYFEFREGRAEVLYYGERHLINERGEFVD